MKGYNDAPLATLEGTVPIEDVPRQLAILQKQVDLQREVLGCLKEEAGLLRKIVECHDEIFDLFIQEKKDVVALIKKHLHEE